jgi:hypothetical protein
VAQGAQHAEREAGVRGVAQRLGPAIPLGDTPATPAPRPEPAVIARAARRSPAGAVAPDAVQQPAHRPRRQATAGTAGGNIIGVQPLSRYLTASTVAGTWCSKAGGAAREHGSGRCQPRWGNVITSGNGGFRPGDCGNNDATAGRP